MNFILNQKFLSLACLGGLILSGCGGGNNNQAAVPVPQNIPGANCVAGQPCVPGGVVAINSVNTRYSGLVNLNGDARQIIKDAKRRRDGGGWSWSFNSEPTDYNHGILDLQAEPNPAAQAGGQIIYRVTLTLGTSNSGFGGTNAITIVGDSPLLASGSGSQLQINRGDGYGYGPYGHSVGNDTGHQFNIISPTPLDGSTTLVTNVQIVVDNQYPTVPQAAFGQVDLSLQNVIPSYGYPISGYSNYGYSNFGFGY
jgi:hypothetical protein